MSAHRIPAGIAESTATVDRDQFERAAREAMAIVKAGKRRRTLHAVAEHEAVLIIAKPGAKPGAKATFLFRVSRERKARIMDGVAVALLLLLAAALGCILVLASAPNAKADNPYDRVAYAYAATYAAAVCGTLDDGHASTDGLLGIMAAVEGDGLSAAQAGEVVAISIYETCPRYSYLIDAFIARYGRKVSLA